MEITSELGRNREKIGEVHDKVRLEVVEECPLPTDSNPLVENQILSWQSGPEFTILRDSMRACACYRYKQAVFVHLSGLAFILATCI